MKNILIILLSFVKKNLFSFVKKNMFFSAAGENFGLCDTKNVWKNVFSLFLHTKFRNVSIHFT